MPLELPSHHADPQYNFLIEIPPQWDTQSPPDGDVRVVFLAPDSPNGFRNNVNVTVQPLQPLDAEEYVTLCRLQVKRLSGQTDLDLDQPRDDEYRTQVFEWFLQSPGQTFPLRARQRVLIRGPLAFSITATATEPDFAAQRDTFEAILDSFHFK